MCRTALGMIGALAFLRSTAARCSAPPHPVVVIAPSAYVRSDPGQPCRDLGLTPGDPVLPSPVTPVSPGQTALPGSPHAGACTRPRAKNTTREEIISKSIDQTDRCPKDNHPLPDRTSRPALTRVTEGGHRERV